MVFMENFLAPDMIANLENSFDSGLNIKRRSQDKEGKSI